jgi:pyruvate/2-oxoglutarate dehydrogenase complex dihydrolipoamide acyltransferase (E2) component
MSEERAQQPNTDTEEEALPRQRQDNGETAPNGGRPSPDQQEPDVLLDVANLEVEKITLEVDDLRAHVSVLAELANLVSLSVGADVRLGRVKLEIVGVKAQALLKVRLEHVRAILEKALDTVAEHPEILEILAQTLSEVLREALGTARTALDDVLEGLEVGDTVDELLKGRLEDIRADLDDALEGQGGEAQEALGESGRTVQRVVEESGSVVEQTLNQSGEVTEETVVGDASTTEGAAGEEEGEARATPAAERRARELGVDLSSVEGTGSGGRITVRDVQNAAQA